MLLFAVRPVELTGAGSPKKPVPTSAERSLIMNELNRMRHGKQTPAKNVRQTNEGSIRLKYLKELQGDI